MNMQNTVSAFTLLVLDFLWISVFMGNEYKRMIPDIQNGDMKIRPLYATLSYLLMIIGMIVFVTPQINEVSLKTALKYGGLFGMVVYGVYGFTAATVLKNWNITVAIVDILWGIVVYTAAAYAGSFYIATNTALLPRVVATRSVSLK